MSTKIIIIGGGIAGLSTAYHLSLHSEIEVILIEKNICGQETSSKAAGMLTPASEVHLEEAQVKSLYTQSHDYYPKFIEKLLYNCKTKIDYKQDGCLLVGLTDDGDKDLQRQKEFLDLLDFEYEELNSSQIQKKEPLINPQIQQGLWIHKEGYINPLDLIKVFVEQIQSLGGKIIEKKSVTEFNIEKNQIQSLKLNSGEIIEGDIFVLASGNGIPKLPFEIPLRPVKGQALALKADSPLIQNPIRAFFRYPIYMVPGENNQLIIGATSEEKSDENITAGALLDLIYAAWQILPIVYELPVKDTWFGFRPTSPDHQPILGKSSLQNLYLNLGLYRHGILLSPYLGKELAQLILEKETTIDWNRFSLDRF